MRHQGDTPLDFCLSGKPASRPENYPAGPDSETGFFCQTFLPETDGLPLRKNGKAVLRIWAVYPGSGTRIFPFRTPDPGSKRFRIPDPDPHQIVQGFLSLKTVSKLLEKLSGMFIPDPIFFPIPDPGSRGQKAPDPKH
jgi:hypothetical protein